jgi:hypothetical protein
MGWNWNDALGGAIDGFLTYGPYGAIAGGAAGGWSEDLNKIVTGDSNSGFVEQFYGGKTGGAGSKIFNSFDTNNGGRGGNQGTGANEPAWGTTNGFSWGSLFGNTGNAVGSYFGNRYGMGNQGGQLGMNLGSMFGNALEGRDDTYAMNGGVQDSMMSFMPRKNEGGTSAVNPDMIRQLMGAFNSNENQDSSNFAQMLPTLLRLSQMSRTNQYPVQAQVPNQNAWGTSAAAPSLTVNRGFDGIYG